MQLRGPAGDGNFLDLPSQVWIGCVIERATVIYVVEHPDAFIWHIRYVAMTGLFVPISKLYLNGCLVGKYVCAQALQHPAACPNQLVESSWFKFGMFINRNQQKIAD